MAGANVSPRTLATLASLASGTPSRAPTLTAIPRFTIWFNASLTRAMPAMFECKFYMIVQGSKRLVIRGKALNFTAGDCAVSSIDLPFTTQVTEASLKRPYIGVELKLDAGVIASLLVDMPAVDERSAPFFAPAQATRDITEPLDRLVSLLSNPADIRVLAPQIERELYYRLLQGPMGGTLRTVVQNNTRFDQIRTAVRWICANANQAISVKRLAASVGMSVTSFHRHFKIVTGLSPLSYQRHIRLLEAQRLIASGATNVTEAAFATGYASSSQFSREYKRMFGVPPIRDAPTLVSNRPRERNPPLRAG